MDWDEVVRGSLFDAAFVCPRCSQREEDGDELPGEKENNIREFTFGADQFIYSHDPHA